MSKRRNQRQRILLYMQTFGWITPMDAIREIGCYKLSTRIGELIREGIKIEKQIVWAKTWTGERTHYMKYRLVV